jgi:peptidylprolyl isomerase
MRRLVIACSLITATTFLLVSCRAAKKENNNPTTAAAAPATTQVGTKTMNRVQMPSGVSYEVLQEGTGATPSAGNKVTVHYTGWLDNNGQLGQQFDSSHKRSQPFTFQLGIGMVIKGWDEGVKTMKVGEKRRLFIPSNLGYGSRGAGSVIPANANLIFDVELLSITP